MKNRGLSLGWRLSLALVGVSIFTLLVVGLVFYAFIGRFVIQRQEQQLVTRAEEVADQLPTLLPEAGAALDPKALNQALKAELKGLPGTAGVVVFKGATVLAKAGSLPQKTAGAALLRLEAGRLTMQGSGVAVLRNVLDLRPGERVIVAAAPVATSGAKTIVAFILPTANAFADRGALIRLLLIAGAIAVAAALALGFGVGRWLSKPVRRLASSAAGMARGSYEEPVSGSYPGELDELAGNLESMRREVKRSDESLRTFVASAAHELRTPLTSIQGFSQALLDGTAATAEQQQRAAAAVYRESARLQRLVNALLMLSRYDAREFQPGYAYVDAVRVVREEIERLEYAGLAPAGRIRLDAPEPVAVVSDEDMFRQVVANLLRNAVQYGGEDVIDVALRPGAAAAGAAAAPAPGVTLLVANGGPPLTVEDRRRIFERFYRGSGSQRGGDGLGLGLALVSEICSVLRGSVVLVGQGPRTTFRVDLPSAAPGQPAQTTGPGRSQPMDAGFIRGHS